MFWKTRGQRQANTKNTPTQTQQKTNMNICAHPELKDGRHNEERRGYGHSEGPHEHNEIPGILIHTPQIQIQIENFNFDREVCQCLHYLTN